MSRPNDSGGEGNDDEFSFVHYEPERYDELLAERSSAESRRFRQAGLLPDGVEMEVHPSEPRHYRLRVGMGVYDPRCPTEWRLPCATRGDRLRYVYWDSGVLVPVAGDVFPVASRTVCAAMPPVLDWLCEQPVLRRGIRAAKFLSTLDGQLLLTLVYKNRTLEPGEEGGGGDGGSWAEAAAQLRARLGSCCGCVGIIGRSRAVKLVDYVVERGIVLSDGRQLVYKQPEQAFSNPNGGMAIHTLDWLSSCAHTIRGARKQLRATADPPAARQPRAPPRVPKSRNVRGVLLLVLDGGRLLRLPASGRAAERGWGWDLPGSAVAEGETAEAAAERVLSTAVLAGMPADERARRRYEYRGGAHLASTKSQLFVYGSVGGSGACAVDGAEWVDLDGAALGASYRLREALRWLPPELLARADEEEGGSAEEDEQLHLLELYCGNGNHTVAMAGVFDRVLAVEINPKLVAAGEENMALNGVGNVELLCVNAEHFSRNMLGSRTWAGRVEGRRYNFDTVLVDPPRAGLDASTRGKVAAYPFIMYISCNPTALERDLHELGKTHDVLRFAFFDHFPYTKHVECGALLVARPRKVASADQPDTAAHEKPGAKVAKEASGGLVGVVAVVAAVLPLAVLAALRRR